MPSHAVHFRLFPFEDDDAQDDESDDDNARPFADLFSRLRAAGPSKAKPGRSAQPAQAKPKAKAASKSRATNTKRGIGATGSDFGGQAPLPKSSRRQASVDGGGGVGGLEASTQSMSADDKAADSRFQALVEEFYTLEANTDDEAAFGRWAAEKIQAMQELRTQIANKKKTLKRRSGGNGGDSGFALAPCLERHTACLNKMIDFVRKLSAGHTEGKLLYGMLTDQQDVSVTVCQSIWKRAIRAVAFDALKLTQWTSFFTETYVMTTSHVPDDPVFFEMLASQLLQRLLKALPTNKVGKGVDCESLGYLRGFVDKAIEHQRTTLPAGWDADDHDRVLTSIRSILDTSAPPAIVSQAAIALKAAADTQPPHWAASSFGLPQGKVVVDVAMTNATAKEAVAGVLEVLHAAEDKLQKSGLTTLDTPFMVTGKSWFNQAHGVMLSGVLRDLNDKKMLKSLKGADREKLLRIQHLARTSVTAALMAHVNNELVPYLDRWATCLAEGASTVEELLTSEICIMNLADGSGHGHESFLEQLKEMSAFLCFLAQKMSGQSLQAEDASSLTTQWNIKAKALSAAFAGVMGKAKVTESEDVATLIDKLKSALDNAGSAIDKSLQSGVHEEAWTCVKSCLLTLSVVLKSGAINETELGQFSKNVESAKMYSTVLGEVGKHVRDGIGMAELLVMAVAARSALDSDQGRSESDDLGLRCKFIRAIRAVGGQAGADDVANSLQALNEREHVGQLQSGDLENINVSLTLMREESHSKLTELKIDCQTRLTDAVIEDTAIELPDSILNLECYDQILAARNVVQQTFPIEQSKLIAEQATVLDQALEHAKDTAASLDMPLTELVANIANFQACYRNALRFMATGNVLYALLSKAVQRAVASESKPSNKAMQLIDESIQLVSDHETEIPAGLQAVVSKVRRAEEDPKQK